MTQAPGSRTLAHVFPTFEAGGTQRRTCELIKALPRCYRHVIVTLDGGATEPADLLPAQSDVQVVRLPKASSFQTVARIRSVFVRERPDLVLTYDWGAFDGLVARELVQAVPHLHYEDGITAEESSPVRRRTWARRLALPRVSHVVVPSKALRDVAESSWRVPAERIEWIPNGVDVQCFRPRGRDESWRSALGIPTGNPIVGSVSRLSPIKNVERLLTACAELCADVPAHVVIAGVGSEQVRLREVAERLGLAARVHWLGREDRPQRLYPEFDLFALASDSEQQPLALLEAMASGLPVVTTRVGDIAWMLPAGQHPFLVDPDQAAAPKVMAQAMSQILSNPALRDQLGQANRTRVEESFLRQTMLERHIELYERTLAGR